MVHAGTGYQSRPHSVTAQIDYRPALHGPGSKYPFMRHLGSCISLVASSEDKCKYPPSVVHACHPRGRSVRVHGGNASSFSDLAAVARLFLQRLAVLLARSYHSLLSWITDGSPLISLEAAESEWTLSFGKLPIAQAIIVVPYMELNMLNNISNPRGQH